jgi:hypothetical protein
MPPLSGRYVMPPVNGNWLNGEKLDEEGSGRKEVVLGKREVYVYS